MRYSIAAFLLFLLLQFYLRLHIDTRDLPGAAGSLSVYRALQANTETGSDWAALSLFYLQRYSGLSIQTCNHALSLFSGFLSLLGGYCACFGVFGSAPKRGIFLLLLWPFPHYFGLLTGVDTLAFGISWLGIGLLCSGIRLQWIGLPFACLGLTLLPLSISIKEAALPVLAFSIWGLFSLPRRIDRQSLIVFTLLGGYCLYWSYAWFFPDSPTRVSQTSLSVSALEQGWQELQRLPKRGMPEGKLDQLLLLSLLGFLMISAQRIKFLLLSIFTAVIILYTAYSLGSLLRPRYLAPAFYSVPILLSFVLEELWKKGATGKSICGLLLFLVFMDSWAFFYIWGQARAELTGSSIHPLPRPPAAWLYQYQKNTDINQKDLSFYGSIEIIEQIEQREQGIAVPRLRDDRHNSVKAFNSIYGYPSLILDPGRCCLGTPVDQHCANRIVENVRQTGLILAIPRMQKGIERVQGNEKSWIQDLLNAAAATNEAQEGIYWIFLPPEGTGGDLPCQKDWKSPAD